MPSGVFPFLGQPLAYMRILSCDLPPSNSYTGTPSALPLMSHSARSMALIALVVTGPPDQVTRRYRDVHKRSISKGFLPIRNRLNAPNSAINPSSLYCKLASPNPYMPASVSIFTNVQFVPPCPGVPIRMTCRSVIFIRLCSFILERRQLFPLVCPVAESTHRARDKRDNTFRED